MWHKRVPHLDYYLERKKKKLRNNSDDDRLMWLTRSVVVVVVSSIDRCNTVIDRGVTVLLLLCKERWTQERWRVLCRPERIKSYLTSCAVSWWLIVLCEEISLHSIYWLESLGGWTETDKSQCADLSIDLRINRRSFGWDLHLYAVAGWLTLLTLWLMMVVAVVCLCYISTILYPHVCGG